MRVVVGLMAFLLLMAGIALPGTANAKSAGDDAFLIESVDSVADLVKQVEGSRLLVLRYAKHFRVDPSNVITYFRNELSIEELKDATPLDVYYRKGLSDVESKLKDFKKGTKVFVNRNGIPILELGTGNPLADVLPGKDVKKLAPKSATEAPKPTAANGQPQPGQQPTIAQTTPGANQLPNTVPGQQTSPLADQVASAAATEPETAVLASGPIETVAKVATKAAGKGLASALSGWVLPAGLVGAAALAGTAGGGGGSDPISGGGDKNDPPVAVPEPAGLLALSAGLSTLAGSVCRRRRSR